MGSFFGHTFVLKIVLPFFHPAFDLGHCQEYPFSSQLLVVRRAASFPED
jgi:hypothetical protein